MHAFDRYSRRGRGCDEINDGSDLGTAQGVEYDFEPLRTVGVSRAWIMQPAGGIPDYRCRH